MSRYLMAALLALIVASCGRSYTAPDNLDNACRLVQERPQYLSAMQATEQKWGVPIHVQMATIHQESSFIGDAKTPRRWFLGIIPRGRISTAYGYAQALDGTWDEYQQETGNRFARRTRIDDATDFMGWYMNHTERRNGIPKSDARRQYLAYHEGRAGYRRGSYNQKPWLLNVANRVDSRAERYRGQLATCSALR